MIIWTRLITMHRLDIGGEDQPLVKMSTVNEPTPWTGIRQSLVNKITDGLPDCQQPYLRFF